MSERELEIRDMRKVEKFFIDDAFVDAIARITGIYVAGVYACLCRHASRDQECHPSMRLISQELNISERQVIRAIQKLEAHHLIQRKRMGKKLTNRYALLDKAEWLVDMAVDNHKSDVTDSHITGDYQSLHHVTTSHIHRKDTQLEDTHRKDTARASAEAGDIPPKSQKRKRHTPEDFNFLKDYQLRTWKLAGGEYPWGRVDAGMISRLLNSYTLATGMALLDLFWVEIRKFDNDWVLKNMGRNAKGLLHMLPRLMDNPDLKVRAEKHERALLEAITGADMKAGDDLARTLAAGIHQVPKGPDHDAQRRTALDKADQLKGAA